MGQKINAAGLSLIKGHETLVTFTYDDAVYPPKPFRGGKPKGTLTIGYGHTGPDVKPGMRITDEEADRLLSEDIGVAERAVASKVKVPLSNDQFSALVSLVFNIGVAKFGTSTLLKRLNAGDYVGAADQFLVWDKTTIAGKKVQSKGLAKRRPIERDLFLRGTSTVPDGVVDQMLRLGSRGPRVEALQKRLRELRYFEVGKIDGVFGQRVRDAVLAFQARNGLLIDGVVGPQTWKEIESDSALPKEEAPERQSISAKDLVAAGSTTTVKTGWTQKLLAGVGLTGAAQGANEAGLLDQARDAAGAAYEVRGIADALIDTLQWCLDNWWILAIPAGVIGIFWTHEVIKSRVQAAREGRDVSI